MNPKVIVSVLAVIVLSYFFAPQLLRYSGLLILLICPLSMVLMMVMMNKSQRADDTKKDDTKNI